LKDSHLNTIINKCKKNDRGAQNELYKHMYSYGLGICGRYIKDELEARTVLNEGFYKIYRNIFKYENGLAFKPWFKTILINTALDYLRKNKKFKTDLSIDKALDVSVDSNAISELSFKELMAIVNTLPTAYRTVFNMYVVDGYKHKEIAEKLSIEVGTSKSNLSRAKAILRQMIKTKILV